MFITLKDVDLLVTFLNDKRRRQETFHLTVFTNKLLIEITKIGTLTFEINFEILLKIMLWRKINEARGYAN